MHPYQPCVGNYNASGPLTITSQLTAKFKVTEDRIYIWPVWLICGFKSCCSSYLNFIYYTWFE